MPKLIAILASTRPGRAGPPVARWFTGLAEAHGVVEVELVDLAEPALPMIDEPEHPGLRRYTHDHTRAWSAVVEAADAAVLVTAECNHGYPAPLRNALDFL